MSDTTNLELREFQSEDLEFFLKQPRSLILYEPRLGKTVVGVSLAALGDHKTVIVLCTRNAIPTWVQHVEEWFKRWRPEKTVKFTVISTKYTNADKRHKLWSTAKDADCNFFIATPSSWLNDCEWLKAQKFSADCYLLDEYHRFMKNHKGKIFKALAEHTKDAKRIHALSGTPVSKNAMNYFGPLKLMWPKRFTSYYGFLNTWCITIKTMFGTEIVGHKNADQFQLLLRQYARIRKRKDVRAQMPTVQRAFRNIEPTEEQRKLWELMNEDMFYITESEEVVVASTPMERDLRKRQLLVCPKILDPKGGIGAAMEDFVEMLQEAETDDERHTVIFTPYRAAVEAFKEYLHGAGFTNTWTLYGGIDHVEMADKIRLFRERKGIIICTTSFAQSFSLVPATHCWTIGYSADPNDSKQAEDRLVGQDGGGSILSTYYHFGTGTDTRDREILSEKSHAINELVKGHDNPK